MNERNSAIRKIMEIEKKIWIPISRTTKSQLEFKNTDELKKYLRSVELILEKDNNHIEEYISCDKCGKYLAKIEIKSGTTCFECEGKTWF